MHKSPQQQIMEARAALQRAMLRQRKSDARQKIVIGATAWNWLCQDQTAASRFIGHVSQMQVREQDRDALESVISELRKTLPSQSNSTPERG